MKSDDVIAAAALPDFDRMAADYDLFLPLIQLVGWPCSGTYPNCQKAQTSWT